MNGTLKREVLSDTTGFVMPKTCVVQTYWPPANGWATLPPRWVNPSLWQKMEEPGIAILKVVDHYFVGKPPQSQGLLLRGWMDIIANL